MHYHPPTLRCVPTHLSLGILESPEGKSDVFYPPPLFPPSLPSLLQLFPNYLPGKPYYRFIPYHHPSRLSLHIPSPASLPPSLPPLPLPPPPHLQSRSWMTTTQHHCSTIVVRSPHLTPFPHLLPPSRIPSMMSKVPAGVRDSPSTSPSKNWRSDCQHIT